MLIGGRAIWRFAWDLATFAALAVFGSPAWAGPPFLTDDPIPADKGHWEFFAFAEGDGFRSKFAGNLGLDVNYGAAQNLQLTVAIPLSFENSPGEAWGTEIGDAELGAKFRFINDEANGFTASVFPAVTLPTAHISGGRARLFLPIWLQKEFGDRTSMFGGGGLTVNPGTGNRNYWEVGIALTHEITDTIAAGFEFNRQGPDADGATAETAAGIGLIVKIGEPYALLFSGGPLWADDRCGYRGYAALGMNF